MDLYLQFGARMMKLSRELFATWEGGRAILSPRDLKPDQLRRLSAELRDLDGSVLVDPQFYIPRADYHRLVSHEYWPDNYDTAGFGQGDRRRMLESLTEMNRTLATTHLVIPGERANVVDSTWLGSQRGLYEAACDTSDRPLIMTICLSADAVRSEEQVDLVMGQAEHMDVDGFYLVIESPKGYLSDDPLWLANALGLVAGLRRLGKDIIVGYSNHQQLIMACAGANAIASGTYGNVRSFPHSKFQSDYGKGFVPRPGGPVWYYYCPQALSEYTLQFLDLAVSSGLKSVLESDPATPYATPLFAVPQPSATGWSQSFAFKHYLTALRSQAQDATRGTFDETAKAYRTLLDRAETILETLRENGITGRGREFWLVLDTNRAALASLENTQGPLLRRVWKDLM